MRMCNNSFRNGLALMLIYLLGDVLRVIPVYEGKFVDYFNSIYNEAF